MKRIQKILLMASMLVWGGAGIADAGMTRSSAEALMASGKSMTCDFESQESSGTQQGTIYIANQKMRGDFKVADRDSGTYDAHMVHDGQWAYIWGGPMGESQGTKMRMDKSAASGGQRQGFDPDKEMDMDCREWNPDASKFAVPSHVEFMDMSQMMQGVQQAGGGMKQMQCQACDQVPAGSDREMCRQMMGC